MKTILKLLAFLVAVCVAVCASAGAQVAPEATQGPAHWDYSLHYAQTAEFGGPLGDWQTGAASGMLNYGNGGERLPLTLTYTGGYTFTYAGPHYATGLFQRMLIAQGIMWRKFNIVIDDNVSYRPQAPTTGFAGIPGIGNPIGTPSPTPPSSQTILTLNTHVVDNVADLTATERLNYATNITGGGGYEVRRYPDNNGININDERVTSGLKGRLNARNTLTVDYNYSNFSYPDYGFSFTSQSPLFGLMRLWNPRISTTMSGGPQWISSSDSTLIPSSVRFAIKAGATYKGPRLSGDLQYNHAVNDGGGYLIGAESDIVTAAMTRQYGRQVSLEFNGSYRRTAGLVGNGITTGKFGGVQANRRWGKYLALFGTYTLIDQSTSSNLPGNVQTRLLQVISFGIGYSPRQRHISTP